MKITHIGHAAIVIECSGVRILSDPWWQGPCFGSQWWIYPKPDLAALEPATLDYIYISHGHADHLHPGTLQRLPKRATCLVSKALGLAEPLRRMGFAVREIAPDEEVELAAGLRCRVIPTHGDDTLLALSDGSETCLNLNDALHAAPADVQDRVIGRLRSLYPRIDYLFCGYGVASHFPNCYLIPGKDRVRSAIERQRHFNGQWAAIVHRLAPRFAFPFAADVVFLDRALFWCNEPTHNAERPTDRYRAAYPNDPTEVRDIAPGFTIEDGRITREVLFTPLDAGALERVFAEEIARVNAPRPVEPGALDHALALLQANLAQCEGYLREYPGDYRFLIRLHGAEQGIEIVKSGQRLMSAIVPAEAQSQGGYEVVLTTRYAYLRRALATEFGHETLFVGSGCTIAYADPARVAENLHCELTVLLRRRTAPPPSRFGDQPRLLHALKRSVKAALGRRAESLYDLGAWTWFEDVSPASARHG